MLRWKLTLTNYNCSTHIKFYHERGWIPDCRKPGGTCKIGEHLATNEDLNALINHYLCFKRLPAVERSLKLGDKILEDSGLIDHPDLLIRLEILYHEIQATQIENERIKKRHQEMARRR